MNLLKAALWYSEHGLPVFPCVPKEKRPITPHGFKSATCDANAIREWWSGTPDANIGLPTGFTTHRLVVDFDPRNGSEDSETALVAKYGRFPDTAEQMTGSGGRHRIYAYSGGAVPKELAPGVDLKGDGGYILVAPSVTVGPYNWDGISGAKALLNPAPAPAWLLDFIADGRKAGKRSQPIPDQISDGKKHTTCVSLAGSMRRRGCNADEIFAALLALSKRFESAVAEANLRAIAEDACKRWTPEADPERQIVIPNIIDMESLIADASIARPEMVIEGFLPRVGLAVIGGRPKDGKSWLACQIALAVATGQPLGGWLRVLHPGRVQLWALEDQFALTKDKTGKLLGGAHPDGLNDLKVIQELAKPVLAGGDAIIRAMLDEHPAELVILDSLFKLTGAGQPQYDICQKDYDTLDRLRKIAIERQSLFIVIMHTKKGATGGNPIENLLGTSGTTAVPDVLAELKRHKDSGKLTVVGRAVPSEDYQVDWHGGPDEWGWTIGAQGDEASGGETQDEVLEYLDAQGATTPAVIARETRRSFRAVWSALQRLQTRGKVRRTGKKWELVR